MILSKLTQAIREQNWFAVVVEFVIVIAGVVIGFQITAWNAEREQERASSKAIDDLLTEAEAIIRYIQSDIDRVYERLVYQEKALAALSAGDDSSLEPGELNLGLDDLREYRGVRPPRTVYDNLEGSGGLNALNNQKVVEALANYYAMLDNVANATDLFQYYIIQDYDNISDHPAVQAVYDPELPARRRMIYDFQALSADSDAIEEIVNQVESQITFQFIRMGLMAEAQTMCRVLAEAAERPCKPFEEVADDS